MTLEVKPIIEFKINPEYESIVPPLSKHSYQELKESIKKYGQAFPISVNEKYEILDGHHRYRICKELGIEPKTEIKKFDTIYNEKRFVIYTNATRRHLQIHEKAALAIELKKIEDEEARDRQSKAGLEIGSKNLPNNDSSLTKILVKLDKKENTESQKDKNKKNKDNTSRKRAAKRFHLSDETLRKYEYVLKNGTPDLIEQMTKGWMKISKAYDKIKYLKVQEERRREIERKEKEQNKKDWPKLYCGKFQDIKITTEIPDNSIDLIFTDPPYDYEHIFLYIDLATLASTKLKPGGSLVCYANHYLLPQIFDIMEEHANLEYWWTIGEFHQSQSHSKMFNQNVTVSWKPLLWFVKKGKPPHNVRTMTMFIDSIRSRPPESKKLEHEWEQSIDDALYIIEKLSDKGDIVLDPMCGSGTTGVAAEKTERLFIGIDELQEHIDETKTRILYKEEEEEAESNIKTAIGEGK